jgi:hypothetical protein
MAYFAAQGVRHAPDLGQCVPKTGIQPFERLVEHVMTQEPDTSA